MPATLLSGLLSGLRRGWVMDELDSWTTEPTIQLVACRWPDQLVIDLNPGDSCPVIDN